MKRYRIYAGLTIVLLAANLMFPGTAIASAACSIEEGMTFEHWRSWEKLTPKPLFSKGHSEKWVDVYVNELAEEIYRNADEPYPQCAKIVKATYEDEQGTEFWSLTVMVKMSAGYDPENGDWWYASYRDESGIKPFKQGRLYDDCILCHKSAAYTDYLFSHDVMIEVNKN